MHQNKSFAGKTTNSQGKTVSESYEDAHIDPILRVLNREYKRPKCAILVGDTSGFKRHYKRMLAKGFSERDIVIFEWDKKAYLKLKRFATKRGYKCQVLFGDLIDGVQNLINLGHIFTFVEFDGVQRFGDQEPRLYDLIKRNRIPVLVSQGTGRAQSPWFKNQAKRLGAKRHVNNNGGIKCFKLTDSVCNIFKKHLPKYDSHLITYGGRETLTKNGRKCAPMYMQISIGGV